MSTTPWLPWWHFRQNNVMGWWCQPAINVYVQAETPERARERLFEETGAHNDHCDCCGWRWPGGELVEDAATVEQLEAGEVPSWAGCDAHWAKEDKVPEALVLG